MLARSRRLGLAGLLCLAPLLAAGQDEPHSGDPSSSGATAVFERLEQAWTRGDAQSLVTLVGARKVSLDMPELEHGGGSFSRGQIELIFAKHFEDTETRSFEFQDLRAPEGGPSVAVGLAQRRLRAIGAGTVRQDRVLVTLVREGNRWVLSRITVLR
jgi:hypothetical protein